MVNQEGKIFYPKCGKENKEGAKFYKYCGEELRRERVKEEITKQPKTSGLAIASLVLGILFFVPLAPLVAIVFAIFALITISKSKGELKGEGMAIAGLVLGGLMILFIMLFMMFFLFSIFAFILEL